MFLCSSRFSYDFLISPNGPRYLLHFKTALTLILSARLIWCWQIHLPKASTMSNWMMPWADHSVCIHIYIYIYTCFIYIMWIIYTYIRHRAPSTAWRDSFFERSEYNDFNTQWSMIPTMVGHSSFTNIRAARHSGHLPPRDSETTFSGFNFEPKFWLVLKALKST